MKVGFIGAGNATNAHIDAKPDTSLAGVTRSRAALKGCT